MQEASGSSESIRNQEQRQQQNEKRREPLAFRLQAEGRSFISVTPVGLRWDRLGLEQTGRLLVFV